MGILWGKLYFLGEKVVIYGNFIATFWKNKCMLLYFNLCLSTSLFTLFKTLFNNVQRLLT